MNRRALIDFDSACFGPWNENIWARDFPSMLRAFDVAGLRIIGSAPSPIFPDGVVRLIVEGSRLPDECDQGCRLVRPTFIIESSGDQRIIKLEALEIVGCPNMVLAA